MRHQRSGECHYILYFGRLKQRLPSRRAAPVRALLRARGSGVLDGHLALRLRLSVLLHGSRAGLRPAPLAAADRLAGLLITGSPTLSTSVASAATVTE